MALWALTAAEAWSNLNPALKRQGVRLGGLGGRWVEEEMEAIGLNTVVVSSTETRRNLWEMG